MPAMLRHLLLLALRAMRWPLPHAVLFCLALPVAAQGDRASEEAIKAGFIFNFAKFTEWPAGAAEDDADTLRICSLGANPLDGRLVHLNGRMIQNRKIAILPNMRAGNWAGCHVLFLAAADGQIDAVLRALTTAPVLTIGDRPGFAEAGGMIGLREMDQRIRFEVNLAAAQRAGLRMNSQMLKLASRVLQ